MKLLGLRVGQIRMIFKPHIFSDSGRSPRPPLAFVEWFKVKTSTDPAINMFLASKEWIEDVRACDIIPLEDIVQPCPLVPKFGASTAALEVKVGEGINMFNVMDVVDQFWINPFHSKFTYQTVF